MGGKNTTDAIEKILMMPFCSMLMMPREASSRNVRLPETKEACSLNDWISRPIDLLCSLASLSCWTCALVDRKVCRRAREARLSRTLEISR
ncbi:hypothetical protein D3C80_1780360 [compost metagenome]